MWPGAHRETNKDDARPRALWALFDDSQNGRLYGNLAAAMHGIPQFIIYRQLSHFGKVDPAYARGVRDALARMDTAHETVTTEKDMDAMALEPAQ